MILTKTYVDTVNVEVTKEYLAEIKRQGLVRSSRESIDAWVDYNYICVGPKNEVMLVNSPYPKYRQIKSLSYFPGYVSEWKWIDTSEVCLSSLIIDMERYGVKYYTGKTESSLVETFSDLALMHNAAHSLYKLESVKKWYADIPKTGVLCRVSDALSSGETTSTIRVVYECDHSRQSKFKSENGVWWSYATPLSPDEVEAFIDAALNANNSK